MSLPIRSVDIQGIVNTVIKSQDFLGALSQAVAKALETRIMEFVEPVVQPLRDKIVNLEQKLADLNQYVREELDTHEQYSRRNNLRLFGIPELPNEKTDEIVRNTVRERLDVLLRQMPYVAPIG